MRDLVTQIDGLGGGSILPAAAAAKIVRGQPGDVDGVGFGICEYRCRRNAESRRKRRVRREPPAGPSQHPALQRFGQALWRADGLAQQSLTGQFGYGIECTPVDFTHARIHRRQQQVAG